MEQGGSDVYAFEQEAGRPSCNGHAHGSAFLLMIGRDRFTTTISYLPRRRDLNEILRIAVAFQFIERSYDICRREME